MEIHPYRAAWETRDLGAWIETLTDDVVLLSPLLRAPFRGREQAAELFEVLFGAIDDFHITDEFGAGQSHSFFWQANIGGRPVEGADLIRSNDQGKISEMRVLIRPLVDIATFAAAVGPPLARRRGRIRGLIARLLSFPLRPMLAAIDVLASRLSQPRLRKDR